MPQNDETPDRYDVTIYLANGQTERHDNVTEDRATELEGVFGTSDNVVRVDVHQI